MEQMKTTFSSSYNSLSNVVDHFFPPLLNRIITSDGETEVCIVWHAGWMGVSHQCDRIISSGIESATMHRCDFFS